MNAWYEYIIKKKKVMMRHKDLQNPAIYWIDGVTVFYTTQFRPFYADFLKT